ncbi:hypothetical protein ANN_25589 [Periplaneta americana]|uniref:Uncharacterized protein n=1 Tax=Periplaneta americana TaxID=6978 RepID=A0ABQ8S1F0_PERAM|nr:hypothetical protein ANN_25589 [Periplaneta americana]
MPCPSQTNGCHVLKDTMRAVLRCKAESDEMLRCLLSRVSASDGSVDGEGNPEVHCRPHILSKINPVSTIISHLRQISNSIGGSVVECSPATRATRDLWKRHVFETAEGGESETDQQQSDHIRDILLSFVFWKFTASESRTGRDLLLP